MEEISNRPVFASLPSSLRDFAEAVRDASNASPSVDPNNPDASFPSFLRFSKPVKITLESTETSNVLVQQMLADGTLLNRTFEMMVATDRVYFWCGEVQRGFSVEYPAICLHAISREPVCLYVQFEDGRAEEVVEFEGEDSASVWSTVEFKVHPLSGDAVEVDEMFMAMSECAAMHPDHNFDGDDENESEFINDESEMTGSFAAR